MHRRQTGGSLSHASFVNYPVRRERLAHTSLASAINTRRLGPEGSHPYTSARTRRGPPSVTFQKLLYARKLAAWTFYPVILSFRFTHQLPTARQNLHIYLSCSRTNHLKMNRDPEKGERDTYIYNFRIHVIYIKTHSSNSNQIRCFTGSTAKKGLDSILHLYLTSVIINQSKDSKQSFSGLYHKKQLVLCFTPLKEKVFWTWVSITPFVCFILIVLPKNRLVCTSCCSHAALKYWWI